MSKDYKYELIPYSEAKARGIRKGKCPQCGDERLSLYVDSKTRQLAGEEFGLCERRIECGYKRYPETEWVEREPAKPDAPKTLRLPANAFTAKAGADAATHPANRSAFDALIYSIFQELRGGEPVEECNAFLREMGVTSQARVKADKGRPGTAFWLLDERGRPCDAQFKDYVERDGLLRTYKKADGKAAMHTAHAILRARGDIDGNSRPPRCLFGLHRLATEDGGVVHVFESPKTAVLMSLWALRCQQFMGRTERMPLCVSVMNLTGMRWLWRDREHYARMAPIIRRHPRWVLHPDLKAEDKWQEDAEGMHAVYGGVWEVDKSLRKFATDEQVAAGWDWGDFAFGSPTPLLCDSDLRAYAALPVARVHEPEPVAIEPELALILSEPPPPVEPEPKGLGADAIIVQAFAKCGLAVDVVPFDAGEYEALQFHSSDTKRGRLSVSPFWQKQEAAPVAVEAAPVYAPMRKPQEPLIFETLEPYFQDGVKDVEWLKPWQGAAWLREEVTYKERAW